MSSDLAGDPAVACIYGISGIGKSTDAGFAFPNALFVAAPGALQYVRTVCGFTPKTVHMRTIPEVTDLLPDLAGHFDSVVVDDFSFMAEQTFSVLEKKFSGFRLWGELRDSALEFRDKARHCKIHVVMTCWEQPPKTNMAGNKMRGGPMLSGRLPEQIPAMCDIVLRAMHEPARKPWPAVYRCSADPAFVMKDRFDVANIADPAPMNLGELLRAAGVKLSRLDDKGENLMYKLGGLGMEDLVQSISEKLSGIPEQDAEIANAVYQELREKAPATYVRWVVRDAVDRAIIRLARSEAESKFILF